MKRVALLTMILFMPLITWGCIGNTFYRTNRLDSKIGAVEASTQDRFVPDGLETPFANYVQSQKPCAKQGQSAEPGTGQPVQAWHPIAIPTDSNAKEPTDYFLSFIELDEWGELWYRSGSPITGPEPMAEDSPGAAPAYDCVDPRDQFKHAINLIRYAKAVSAHSGQEGRIRLVVFVHGWKNNASDDSGNVWGFRNLLNHIATDRRCERSGAGSQCAPVVGVFIGWRGATLNLPVADDFTFWNRRDRAARIPGSDLLEVLNDLRVEAKRPTSVTGPSNEGSDASPVLLIGHSFGGLLLERAISLPTTEFLLQQLGTGATASTGEKTIDYQQLFDKVVLVNSAAQAADARQLITVLHQHCIHFHIPDNTDLSYSIASGTLPTKCTDRPDEASARETFMFLAVTSKGDVATQIAMPIGETFPFATPTHEYVDTRDFGGFPRLANQSTWAKHSVANISELRNFNVCSNTDPAAKCNTPCPNDGSVYCLEVRKPTWNHTPYWAALLPTSVVPDHGNVFTLNFAKFLTDIMNSIPVGQGGKMFAAQ